MESGGVTTVAIDRIKGDQPAPRNIIGGEGYASIYNSEATPDPDKAIHTPCADSFPVIVQLCGFNSHRLWDGNKLVFNGGHPWKSIPIAYPGDEIEYQHRTTHDNVRSMLPRASIKEFPYEEGQRVFAEPERITGVDDPVVYHLALVLLPSFVRAGERNELFIEQVILALSTHVQDRFAPTQVPVCTGKGLAPRQLRRVRELIAGHLAEGVSVACLAEEYGLSRSYFTKAFKCSIGVSSYEWLMRMRVDRARELILGSDESFSQTGVVCGFSDQPHSLWIFPRLAGASPLTWRRVKRQRTDAAL